MGNIMEEYPFKRSFYYEAEKAIKRNSMIFILGTRKCGKTVCMRQLKDAFANSVYVDMKTDFKSDEERENFMFQVFKDISDNKNVVYLNGKNVTEEIRSTKVNENVAKFSAIKIVRDKITPLQRKMGESQDIIMEGRDIGTVVFPNADIKIFLDCSLEERARRRYKQNLEKGINSTYEEVLENIKLRHKLETEREVAPFVKAEDAIYIDSTNLTIEDVTEKIIEIISKKRKI